VDPIVIAVGVIVGLAALYAAARRAITVAVLSVADGDLVVRTGGIAPRVLADLRDVVRRDKTAHGTVRIVKDRGRAKCEFSGTFPDAQAQRIRNVVGGLPLAKLVNVRR
jgi:hypothetical protein